MQSYHPRRPSTQVNRNARGLFFLLPVAEQHQRIRKLARSRLNAATIASITGIQAAEVARIIEGAK